MYDLVGIMLYSVSLVDIVPADYKLADGAVALGLSKKLVFME